MNLKQMETYVIKPVLEKIDMYSLGAARLILLTGYVESRYEYVAQISGPARSFWQVEPATANDHYTTYLDYRPELMDKVLQLRNGEELGTEFCLATNMAYAVAMARIKYYRSKTPMPAFDDLIAQANFWKETYNTEHGAGTVSQFIEMCRPIQQELL